MELEGERYLFAHAMTFPPGKWKKKEYYLMGGLDYERFVRDGFPDYISYCGHSHTSNFAVFPGRYLDEEDRSVWRFLGYMRQWYEAGYIYPDAAFTDAYPEELIESGLVLTYPGSSAPGYEMEALFGEEALCLRTTPVTRMAGNVPGFWAIPVTSGNPEAAMKFLNLLYADTRIANLIQYGIASRHYVVLDVESGRISYPYGVSRKSTGYYNPLGLYGDRRKLYTFDTAQLIAQKQAYREETLENEDTAAPFSFETEAVAPQLAALRKAVEKYVPVLESGSVGEECYEEFLEELRRAGLEAVMEEAGRQGSVY